MLYIMVCINCAVSGKKTSLELKVEPRLDGRTQNIYLLKKIMVIGIYIYQNGKVENLHYKCAWSPLEGQIFRSEVTHTFVSGHLAYENGKFNEGVKGERLLFDVK